MLDDKRGYNREHFMAEKTPPPKKLRAQKQKRKLGKKKMVARIAMLRREALEEWFLRAEWDRRTLLFVASLQEIINCASSRPPVM